MQGFQQVNVDYINPKSLPMGRLFGQYKDMNWHEGIIELVFEKAIDQQFN